MSPAKAAIAPADGTVERLLDGDRVVLARALTVVENESATSSTILQGIYPHLGRARTIGVTGTPGAGKSTLVNAYIKELRRRDRTVGVVAIDPSSPLSGGAILGDRIRMADHDSDEGVFVRSLSSRGHLGGLSRTAARVVDVMDAAGRDVVIVETVGTGQAEVEITEIATTKVVVLAPGLGDDVQAIKAGVLEIADIFVVNKADLADADHAARQLTSMLHLRNDGDGWIPPVLTTIATTGDRVSELADAIDAHANFAAEHGHDDPTGRARRLLASIAATTARSAFADLEDPEFDALAERVSRGEISYGDGARLALALLGRRIKST